MSQDSLILFAVGPSPALADWRERPALLPDLSDDIHLWRLRFSDANPSQIENLMQILSADERDRAQRFHFALDRDRYTVGRGLLREILAKYVMRPPQALAFDYGRWGKPRLAGMTGPHFNVTHSDNLGLIAIRRDREVGIDVERVDPTHDHLAIASECFAAEEALEVTTAPPDLRAQNFFRVWTRREALLKASGIGLSGLKSASMPETPHGLYDIHQFVPAHGFIASLAIQTRS